MGSSHMTIAKEYTSHAGDIGFSMFALFANVDCSSMPLVAPLEDDEEEFLSVLGGTIFS
jgi:hypothetical protein